MTVNDHYHSVTIDHHHMEHSHQRFYNLPALANEITLNAQ